MKLKEVCEATGLSRKTIRLYEEKELLVPHKEWKNGREYREYSQEDVESLRVIATLRRAWFTMEEIHTMQREPETIREIFPQYLHWLEAQQTELRALIAAAEQVRPERVESVSQLSQEMSAAAELPLPQWDVTPHFKYLDQLEEVRAMSNEIKKDTQELLEGRISDTKTFRQVALTMDQDQVNNQAITFGQFRELENWPKTESGPVRRERKDSRWMRVLSIIGGVLAILGFLITVITEIRDLYKNYDGTPTDVMIGYIALIGGVVLCIVVRGIAAYQDRQRWIALARQQDLEKQQRKQDKTE